MAPLPPPPPPPHAPHYQHHLPPPLNRKINVGSMTRSQFHWVSEERTQNFKHKENNLFFFFIISRPNKHPFIAEHPVNLKIGLLSWFAEAWVKGVFGAYE